MQQINNLVNLDQLDQELSYRKCVVDFLFDSCIQVIQLIRISLIRTSGGAVIYIYNFDLTNVHIKLKYIKFHLFTYTMM